jgi:HEAT repeat protein
MNGNYGGQVSKLSGRRTGHIRTGWKPLLLVLFAWTTTLAAEDREPSELETLIIGLLHEEDADLRALALEQVRNQAPGETATRLFAAELTKLSAAGQIGLLGALADRGDVAARPGVLEALGADREAAVRAAAIGALGTLGEAGDVPRLLSFLSDGSADERTTARASLVQLRGDDASRAIADALKQGDAALRVLLIEILTERRAAGAIPEILAAAINDDPAIRQAAMASLGQIAGPEHIAGMVQGVLKASPGAERAAAEKAIMFVCQRVDDPEMRAEPLLAVMEELNAADRAAVLSTLGRVGGQRALGPIEAAIADGDAPVHDAGMRALCNWPHAGVATRLIELATAEEHAEHQKLALRALIRVAPLPDGRADDERLALTQKVFGMCTDDADRNLMLQRASAIRTVDSLRFVLPFVDQPAHAEAACLSVVELAHHRGLREPNKAEFDAALDKVIATAKDEVVIERANRYKRGQTWARPVVGR